MAEEQQTQASPSQPPAPSVKSLSGYDEGEALPNGDIIRGTYDEVGALVGWHKEPGASAPHPTANADGTEQQIVADAAEAPAAVPNNGGAN